MGEVRVCVLGSVEIVVDGSPVVVERPQVRQLAAMLALADGRAMASEVLADRLWRTEGFPQDPPAALRVIASRLRSALGPECARLRSERGAYRLEASTDLDEFQRLVQVEGSEVAATASQESLQRAVDLWRGTPLTGLPDATWVADIRWRAERLHVTTVVRLAELLVGDRRCTEAIALLEPLAAENRSDERMMIVLSEALTREGRRSDALDLLASTRAELRSGLGLDPGLAFIQHERAILTGSIDIAESAPSHNALSTVFVGREREVESLVGPSVGVTLLSGQPGVGKTMILEQVVAQLDSLGRDAILVAAPPVPVRAMQALGELLAAILDQGADPETLPPALGNLVAELLPGQETRAIPFTRETLIGSAAEWIAAHAREHDAVLIIDDAHLLDLGTAEVLERVAVSPGCRMILAVRPEASRMSVPLVDSGAVTDLLHLDRLGVDDARRFVDQTLDGQTTDAMVQRLHDRSGGNPLFLALLVGLENEGVPTDEQLPASVLVAVQRRLGGLSNRCQQVLRHAATLGQDFPVALLVPVSPDAVTDLRTAEEAGLVMLDPGARQGRFAHQLVHEGVYQMIPEGERQSWHDYFGRRLEESGAPATAFAHHAIAAADIDPVRAAGAGVAAARMHASAYAWDQCLAVAESSVAVGADRILASLHAELRVHVGMSLRRMGRDSTSELLDAARLAEADGDLRLRTEVICELCGHGGTTLAGTVHDEGHRYLTKVLGEPLPPRDRARLLSAAGPLLSTSDRSPEGREMFLQAMDLVSVLDDPVLELEVLMNTDFGLSSPEDLQTRRANAHRLKELAPNDPDVVWEAAYVLHGIACVEQDLDAAAHHLADIRRLTGLVRARPRQLGRTLAEVAHHVGRGDLDEAETWANRVPEVGGAFSDSWITLTYGAALMSVRHAQGRLPEVVGLVEAAVDSSPSTYHSFRAIAAGVAAAAGDRHTAQLELDRLKPGGFECISLADLPSTMLLSMLADAAVFTGDESAAVPLLERLSPYGDRLAWSGVSTHGPIADRLTQLRSVLRHT